MSASIHRHDDRACAHAGPTTEHVHQHARRGVRQVVDERAADDRSSRGRTAGAVRRSSDAQLGQQTRVVKQFDLAAIERRQ